MSAAASAQRRTVERRVAELLTARRLMLVTAEAATAGLLSHRLTTVPGASTFFSGGIVVGHGLRWPVLDAPSDLPPTLVAQTLRQRLPADLTLCVGPLAADGSGCTVALAGPGDRMQATTITSHEPADPRRLSSMALAYLERRIAVMEPSEP